MPKYPNIEVTFGGPPESIIERVLREMRGSMIVPHRERETFRTAALMAPGKDGLKLIVERYVSIKE
jgi:hypothetical protein